MISKEEFADIYEEYLPKMYSYIYRRTDDELLSQDLSSQVFFKALKNLDKFDPNRWKISTWLYSIMSNLLIDHFRKNEEYLSIEDYENSLSIEEDVSWNIDLEIDGKRVDEVFKKLPAKAQEIITLRIFEELSFVEISKIVWISESWVKMSYSRWIEMLKNLLVLIMIVIIVTLRRWGN